MCIRDRYCKLHAEDGMVNVRRKLCSNDSCTTIPSFNVEGSKTAAYCKRHALDGMANVRNKSCSHDSCTKMPTHHLEGKVTAYCKKHADNGMLSVRAKRCIHISCLKRPRWGVLTDNKATACLHHKGDLLGGPVIDFTAKCRVAGCNCVSRWGVEGKQPTHCHRHGPLTDGLAYTVGRARSKTSSRSPSAGAVRGPSFHVKTELSF